MQPRFLLIRFSSIGDIVLASPAIRCLRKQYPNAFIGVATKKQFAFIYSQNPNVDQVFSLADDFDQFKTEIKQARFDYIIDLHKNLRSKRLAFGMPGKTFSFNKANFRKWIMVRFHRESPPIEHISKRYLDTLKPLNVPYDGQGLDYFLKHIPENMALPPTPFVAIAIGGQHFTKRLPAEKLIDICNGIQGTVVLLGGKEDAETANRIRSGSSNTSITNYAGTLSLDESAFVTRECAVLITHDTGMMHIGAALNKPIISVWGSTIPGFGMTPFHPENSEAGALSIMAEVNDLSCRPCSKIGFDVCPKGHFKCMMQQDTSAISAHANRILSLEKVKKQ